MLLQAGTCPVCRQTVVMSDSAADLTSRHDDDVNNDDPIALSWWWRSRYLFSMSVCVKRLVILRKVICSGQHNKLWKPNVLMLKISFFCLKLVFSYNFRRWCCWPTISVRSALYWVQARTLRSRMTALSFTASECQIFTLTKQTAALCEIAKITYTHAVFVRLALFKFTFGKWPNPQ